MEILTKAERSRRYYQEHSDHLKTIKREWYHKNRDRLIEERRSYVSAHKEEIKAYAQKYNFALKKEILSYYSGNGKPFCKRCGVNDIDVLCLDHVNDEGHDHRKHTNGSGTASYKWLREHQFPEGFQVLCANCNLKKEIERRRRQ